MTEQQLAIANVPVQQWQEPCFEKKAFRNGTIFSELNKPFFAAGIQSNEDAEPSDIARPAGPDPEQAEREQLFMEIMKTGFFLDDLTLFLDTHEEDTRAMMRYREKLQEYRELKRQFAEKFYPLTRECISGCEAGENVFFCWQKGPMPWEGECELCGTTKNVCSFR